MESQFDFNRLATQHSATCFLNSLLREWDKHRISKNQIEIVLDSESALLIPLQKYSLLGRHQYQGNFYFQKDGSITEIPFETAVDLILDLLAGTSEEKSYQTSTFKKRVLASLGIIRDSLKFRFDAIQEFESSDFQFKNSEQALMIGHNFHPTPKSRDEFSEQDMFLYSPEFGGTIHLDWFIADPKIVFQKSALHFQKTDWTKDLALIDLVQTPHVQRLLGQGWVAIPMHPWQFQQIEQAEPSLVSAYIRNGLMIYLGSSHSAWSPTSSLRSLYRDQTPYMLKFSMSLKLTNSIRHLLAREVDRGLQLYDVLSSPQGEQFLAENPNFHIVREPAYLCLKDSSGNPIDATIVVCRENPFNGKEAQGKVVLATLAQDAPLGGENLVQKQVRKISNGRSIYHSSKIWFSTYLHVAIKPMILAQANYGFLLGAHQQNLILDIREGLPVQAYFRDCQGTGYSELGYSLYSSKIPMITRDNGNVLNTETGNYLFSYYLILNSTFNVITALTASSEIDEVELLNDLRIFLEEIRATGVKDASFLDYLLTQTTLMHKGNFFCSLQSINENTSANPFSIYTPVQNPILQMETLANDSQMIGVTRYA